MMRMEPIEKWIWLPKDKYPTHQTTLLTISGAAETYALCHIKKCFNTKKPIREMHVRFSADTQFVVYLNGAHLATGPSSVGGDFLFNDRVYPQQYATELHLTAKDDVGYADALSKGVADFFAYVKMQPARWLEMSHGHGGFFLTAHVTFEDGTKTVLLTDETWDIRYIAAQYRAGFYDGNIKNDDWVKAENIPNIWHCLTSPLAPCTEFEVKPTDNVIVAAPGETVKRTMELDKIYAAYITAKAKTSGPLHVTVWASETGEQGSVEGYIFTEDTDYRGFEIHSAGALIVEVKNEGDAPATVEMGLIATHYPVYVHAKTVTSDDDLNLVTDVCAHTLKYCRQTLHLDSPRHCEPMACTGDYYIEAMMTQFTFGDQTLSAFDVRRTAQLLRYRDGRMFHTTYSLIWVQMLWDVYMLNGDKTLLSDCEDALTILLERFATYVGDNGIIENPPDYMFIDWLYPDGINMHHPPKALGQSCMNMYYYGALMTAAKVYETIGETAMAEMNRRAAASLQKAVCELLYDPARGLFFEGLNTPPPEHLISGSMPQNVEKRYYRKHANVLAAYFGIVDRDTCRDLLTKVMTDESLGELQPYFTHFLLDAIYRNGLRTEYTDTVLRQWVAPCHECSKGLAEGFIAPEGYHFDHSHAWGGTPAYALPLALSGLVLHEPGYDKISLDPDLLGLENAHVEIPTPHGMITIDMERGEDGKTVSRTVIPEGISLV